MQIQRAARGRAGRLRAAKQPAINERERQERLAVVRIQSQARRKAAAQHVEGADGEAGRRPGGRRSKAPNHACSLTLITTPFDVTDLKDTGTCRGDEFWAWTLCALLHPLLIFVIGNLIGCLYDGKDGKNEYATPVRRCAFLPAS